ncbi:VENN motif pre-toxin domain-containing protein [Gilliamella apicola]|uniref:VENN motif-containing domain-containing protein n=1 Tax=Gilliamella apicola TaxID=1196095 RepID=A0A2V4DTC4_9GAMM|nr:VENN motif pre-toxin domain-containing protein [Gilliamella apicola]PXZ03940.1 hypothetical protein DKK79_06045 [Gilliamella apicola]
MGNDFSKGVDSAVSIITGIITGDMTGGLAGASAPWLAEQIKIQAGDNETARLVAHAILGAVVAELQGNSALSGGAGAVVGEVAADIIRKQLYGKEVKDLTEEEKQTISALSQLASSLAVAAGGGNMGDASAAISSSKNAVENNNLYLCQLDSCNNRSQFLLTGGTGAIIGAVIVGDVLSNVNPELSSSLQGADLSSLELPVKEWILYGRDGDLEKSNSKSDDYNTASSGGMVATGGANLQPPDDDNNKKNENNQKQRQQERFDELKDVFDKDNHKTDLKIDGQTIQQGPGSNRYTTRIYESQNLTDRQIYNYAEELAGQPLTKTRDGIYTAKLQDGTTITLRNVSSSVDKTGARWTIDIRNNPTLTNLYRGLRKSAEIKFR